MRPNDSDVFAGLRPPYQHGRAGLALIGASVACFLTTALLGPSVVEPRLKGSAGQPPYSLVAHPSPYLVIGLTVTGIVTGAIGLGLCLLAVKHGWRIAPRVLLIAGGVVAVAFMLMPPIGSSDHLNYAAYGRMAATGHNPYTTTANDLPADPVASSVQEWRDTPTVYGPIATGQQAVASLIGGRSVRLTVFVMSVTNTLAFLAAGAILDVAARGDRGRRLRAALLWMANPLLLFELVGGAHNDTIAVALAVASLALVGRRTRRTAVAGLVLGLAAAVKLNVAVIGGGAAWVMLRRRRWTRLIAYGGTAAAVVVAGYAIAGPHSLDQLHRASKMVSLATPWHPVNSLLNALLGGSQRSLIQVGSVLLTGALVILLVRLLPAAQRNEAGVAAVLAVAWMLAAPYALPWYNGLAWATLALLTWTRLDMLLIAHTSLLALAYLPARDPEAAGLPGNLHWLISVLRSGIIPSALIGLLVVVVVGCLRGRRPAPIRARSRQAPAESPH